MDKNIKKLIERLSDTFNMYDFEVQNITRFADNPGKQKASKIRANQMLSRVSHIARQINNAFFIGNILVVTFIYTDEPHHNPQKLKAILTDISQSDFEFFAKKMSSIPNGPKIQILEIREIPPHIQKIPL